MRVVAVRTLRLFWKAHPSAEQPLKSWYQETVRAQWRQPADIKVHYRSASILMNRRVVFNIKGNEYRLIVAVAFNVGVVYVKFVGTHDQYDAVDAQTVEQRSSERQSMNVRPVRTSKDHRATLETIAALMEADPKAGTHDGDLLDILTTLVQAYEAKHYPVDAPDAVAAIKFRMDQDGLSVKDMEPFIGKSNRVYEVLSHKRPLTLGMIRRLHEGLGIPAEALIRRDAGSTLSA